MDTEGVERLWQAVMRVAADMKRDGLDTGDAVKRLRDAKVLLNHCIHDEHAHGDELFEAELEIDDIQNYLISLLARVGRRDDYPFELKPLKKVKGPMVSGPPSGVPKNKGWARIRLPSGMDAETISRIEGVEVVEMDGGTLTISGNKDSLQKAFAEISKAYSR